MSFQVCSSVLVPHFWLGGWHLSSKALRSSAISPALPYGLFQNQRSKCFLASYLWVPLLGMWESAWNEVSLLGTTSGYPEVKWRVIILYHISILMSPNNYLIIIRVQYGIIEMMSLKDMFMLLRAVPCVKLHSHIYKGIRQVRLIFV